MKDDNKKIKEDKVEEKIDKSEVEKEIEELKQKVGEFENSYRRALADYQNLQKRVNEEKISWLKMANSELLLRLLPVLDTLMLADRHTDNKDLKVVLNQFLEVLKSEGIERVKTMGEDFDPLKMEVVDTGDGEDGRVLDELKAGFLMNDKLLRPAQVRVGKGSGN